MEIVSKVRGFDITRRVQCITLLFVLFFCCSPIAQPQSCTTAPPGIVGWWPGDGNANDIIGGNNGTLGGAATFVPGEVGQAFGFSGNGYVEVPLAPALDPQQVSVAAWVQASTVSSFRYALDNGAIGSGASYALYTGWSGGLFFYIGVTTGFVVLSPDAGTAIWDGNFHFVVGTFDGSAVRLFVDGIQVGNGTPTNETISYSSYNFYIGTYNGTSGFFNWQGAIDEVQVFSRALSASEIQTLYKAASGGVCKGLTFSPASLKFARRPVGTTSPPQTVTASNAFPLPLTVTGTKVKTGSDFAKTANTCATLAPGASCTVSVTFSPTQPGTRTGWLAIVDSAPASPQIVGLIGAATDISLSPTRLIFASRPVGTTSRGKTVTVNNVGSVVVNFTGSGISLAGTDPGDFVISANTCGPSLASGASCTVSIEFKPMAQGTRTATLDFNDDGGASPQTVTLTGSGT